MLLICRRYSFVVVVVRMIESNNVSRGADFIRLELEDGEQIEASSFIPLSFKRDGDVRPRKWTLKDLTSTVDGGRARVIGGGSFGERGLKGARKAVLVVG